MTTQESNKLIAEFMEYPYFLSDSGVDSWGDDDVERWEIGIDNYCTIEQLLFHKSWDWLMPVVDKINSFGRFEVIIGYGRCYITDGEDKLTLSMVENNTQYAVYKAVVEFIQFTMRTKQLNQNNDE